MREEVARVAERKAVGIYFERGVEEAVFLGNLKAVSERHIE
jgi:hypothetical protein